MPPPGAALYTEDADEVTDQGPIFGREAIEKHYADLLQKVHFSNHVLTDDQDSPHITDTTGKEVWETSQPEIAAKAKVRHWGTPSAGRRLIAVQPCLPPAIQQVRRSPPISVAVDKRLFCHGGTGSRGPMPAPAFESARGERGVKT
jgi:hypothetical protein